MNLIVVGLALLCDEYETLGDEMCQCKDSACAEGVSKTFDVWIKKNLARLASGEQQRGEKIADEFGSCFLGRFDRVRSAPGA